MDLSEAAASALSTSPQRTAKEKPAKADANYVGHKAAGSVQASERGSKPAAGGRRAVASSRGSSSGGESMRLVRKPPSRGRKGGSSKDGSISDRPALAPEVSLQFIPRAQLLEKIERIRWELMMDERLPMAGIVREANAAMGIWP